jgi:hypothetical protein
MYSIQIKLLDNITKERYPLSQTLPCVQHQEKIMSGNTMKERHKFFVMLPS